MLDFTVILASMIGAQVYVLLLEPRYILDWLGQYIERLPKRLQKMLTCADCMSGQLSLWLFPIITDQYNVIAHFCTVIFTIWLTHLINRIFYD